MTFSAVTSANSQVSANAGSANKTNDGNTNAATQLFAQAMQNASLPVPARTTSVPQTLASTTSTASGDRIEPANQPGGTYPLSHLYGHFGLIRLTALGRDVPAHQPLLISDVAQQLNGSPIDVFGGNFQPDPATDPDYAKNLATSLQSGRPSSDDVDRALAYINTGTEDGGRTAGGSASERAQTLIHELGPQGASALLGALNDRDRDLENGNSPSRATREEAQQLASAQQNIGTALHDLSAAGQLSSSDIDAIAQTPSNGDPNVPSFTTQLFAGQPDDAAGKALRSAYAASAQKLGEASAGHDDAKTAYYYGQAAAALQGNGSGPGSAGTAQWQDFVSSAMQAASKTKDGVDAASIYGAAAQVLADLPPDDPTTQALNNSFEVAINRASESRDDTAFDAAMQQALPGTAARGDNAAAVAQIATSYVDATGNNYANGFYTTDPNGLNSDLSNLAYRFKFDQTSGMDYAKRDAQTARLLQSDADTLKNSVATGYYTGQDARNLIDQLSKQDQGTAAWVTSNVIAKLGNDPQSQAVKMAAADELFKNADAQNDANKRNEMYAQAAEILGTTAQDPNGMKQVLSYLDTKSQNDPQFAKTLGANATAGMEQLASKNGTGSGFEGSDQRGLAMAGLSPLLNALANSNDPRAQSYRDQAFDGATQVLFDDKNAGKGLNLILEEGKLSGSNGLRSALASVFQKDAPQIIQAWNGGSKTGSDGADSTTQMNLMKFMSFELSPLGDKNTTNAITDGFVNNVVMRFAGYAKGVKDPAIDALIGGDQTVDHRGAAQVAGSVLGAMMSAFTDTNHVLQNYKSPQTAGSEAFGVARVALDILSAGTNVVGLLHTVPGGEQLISEELWKAITQGFGGVIRFPRDANAAITDYQLFLSNPEDPNGKQLMAAMTQDATQEQLEANSATALEKLLGLDDSGKPTEEGQTLSTQYFQNAYNGVIGLTNVDLQDVGGYTPNLYGSYDANQNTNDLFGPLTG